MTNSDDKTPSGKRPRKYGDTDRYDRSGNSRKPARSDNGGHARKRNDDKPTDEPKKPTAKVKLRLDVEDVVRAGNAEEAQAQFDSEIEVEGAESIKILYEDNHILVVIKPRNIPSQADSSGDKDLLSELKKYLIRKYDKPGDAYLGLLHRLDRPTGGVMVFAKTSKAAARLSEQIRAGEFEKCYAAVAVGRPNKTGLVEHWLLKDEQNNIVTLAPSTMEGVKRAASEIKLVDERGELSLVSVKLLTGRTHQVRVQLKALGSPIVGDYKYAGDKLVKCKNLALWAYKLAFGHPVSGEIMRFIAEPPQEFPWSEFDTDALVDIVRPADRRGYNG